MVLPSTQKCFFFRTNGWHALVQAVLEGQDTMTANYMLVVIQQIVLSLDAYRLNILYTEMHI